MTLVLDKVWAKCGHENDHRRSTSFPPDIGGSDYAVLNRRARFCGAKASAEG